MRRQDLQLITREYEEKYMCRAEADEAKCTKMDKCECKLISHYVYDDPTLGCIGRKFVYGNKVSHLCVLCLRMQTAQSLYLIRSQGLSKDTIIQPYRNIINKDGEYKLEYCLYPSKKRFECITDPFVRHQRHMYEYTSHGTCLLYTSPSPRDRG